MPRDRKSTHPLNHLDLSPAARHQLVVALLAQILARLGAETAEKLSGNPELSGLASEPGKSVHVQRG